MFGCGLKGGARRWCAKCGGTCSQSVSIYPIRAITAPLLPARTKIYAGALARPHAIRLARNCPYPSWLPRRLDTFTSTRHSLLRARVQGYRSGVCRAGGSRDDSTRSTCSYMIDSITTCCSSGAWAMPPSRGLLSLCAVMGGRWCRVQLLLCKGLSSTLFV